MGESALFRLYGEKTRELREDFDREFQNMFLVHYGTKIPSDKHYRNYALEA